MKFIALAVLSLSPSALAADYPLAELFPAGKQGAAEVTLSISGPGSELLPKLEAGMKNPALMKDVLAKTKPGQPLAYDPRFGMTEAEFSKLLVLMKSPKPVPTGAKIEVEFGGDKDYFSVKSPSCSLLSGGARVDKITGSLIVPGRDPMKSKAIDVASGTPFAPSKGYTWRELRETPPMKAELTLMRLVGRDICLISCDVLDGQPLRKEEVMAEYDCGGKGASTSSTAATTSSSSASSAPAPRDPVDLLGDLGSMPALGGDKGGGAPSPSTAPAKTIPGDPLAPLCVADFTPVPEVRDIGAQLSHDKNGKMAMHFVPMPKDGGRMIDINKLSFTDSLPTRFTYSDGGARRGFVSVDTSSGSRLNKCLDELAKKIGPNLGEDTLWKFKKFAGTVLRDVPDNYIYDWDLKLYPWTAEELDKVKNMTPGHAPLKTKYTNNAAPLESFLKVRRGGMMEKTMLVSLLMKRLNIPNRVRAGGDQSNYMHWWIELKDGRVLDPASGQLLNTGPAPGFPGWFKFGDVFFYPYQVYMVSAD